MSVTGWGGVTLTVEIALSAATSTYGLWNSGIWNSSTWGPDAVFTDVTDYVRVASTVRQFSRGVRAWQAGTASLVLDNNDGRFSPANLSGPYVTAGVTQIRPMRPVRITATYAGVTYPVYRGYVLEWNEDWTVNATGRGDATVALPCADEFTRFAAFDGLAVTPVGAGDLSGARVHRILDAAGHTGNRNIDMGETTLQATDLSDAAPAAFEAVVDAEGGALWVDADGTVVFDGQHALLENARSVTSQATFGDSGTDLPYADVELAYTSDLVVNIAAYAAAGGTVQTVTDETSRALYGDRRTTKNDLICETDAQALALAQWQVQQYKDPELRISRIELRPMRDPTRLYPQVLARSIRDQITVNRHPPGGHAISQAVHIAGIGHTITPATWVTTFDLWSATPYVAYASSIWNTGLWDTALWSF